MLSLEKLFYQHQYKPLQLSTYLSDYIGDGKSPVKQEECTKRLYQLFLRFFNKFSTFRDQSLSHLILSVSFSVLTYLCENSHGTFSNFFQFGLSAVLIEHIPLKTLTENENSFTKFLSMIHLFCDTHKQTQLESLCHFIVPLLDTISLHHIKIQTKILTSSLVNKLTDCISPATVIQLKSSKAFSPLIVSTGKAIGSMGDVFLQSDVIESIFRLTSRTERVRLADILFTSPLISHAFREISEELFEKESRNFLNTLNTSLGSQQKVFSYPCIKGILDGTVITRPNELDCLWVDFNSASQTLTMFISNPLNTSTPEWVTAYFKRESFTQITVSSSNNTFHMNATLSVSKREICEIFPDTTKSLSLQLSFSSNCNPTSGLRAALGFTGEIAVDLPVSNDNTCKHPLLRGSMSMQAIHLTTHESGIINSHVTDTIPQHTQEDINEVSPIKPSPEADSDKQRPVTLTQQTTPIAPIPPVDPMTSTPINRASFTPVFTPNNIRVVRDDTENVLTLSDEMNQSKKLSVVNKCEKPLNKVNSRNHTPSSLTTHVVTPIEQVSGNKRERVSRINTIAHEINVAEKAISLDGPQCDSSHQETMDAGIVKSNEKVTPRSVRVSNRKKSFHEESHIMKHRTRSIQTYRHSPHTKLRRKDTRVESRLSLLDSSADKLTADVSTKPSEDVKDTDNSPILILDDTIPPKLPSPDNKPSPVAVSRGSKRVALSHSFSFSNDSLSPHLLHDISKYKLIAPKSKSSSTVTQKCCKQTSKTTRVTHSKQISNSNTPPKSRVCKPVSKYSSDESLEEQNVFSPLLDSSVKYPNNKRRARNVKKAIHEEIQEEFNHYRTSNRITQRKSRKSLSNSQRKILPKKPCLSSDNCISTKQCIRKEVNTQDGVQAFEFSIQSGIIPLEKHLYRYEQNLTNYYSGNQMKSFEMKNDRIKELFHEMKDLMTSEEECLHTQFRDWYLETRNLVATVSEVQVAENELKIALQSQFQLAVEGIFKHIQKQQITCMKKRIQSFMIKI